MDSGHVKPAQRILCIYFFTQWLENAPLLFRRQFQDRWILLLNCSTQCMYRLSFASMWPQHRDNSCAAPCGGTHPAIRDKTP